MDRLWFGDWFILMQVALRNDLVEAQKVFTSLIIWGWGSQDINVIFASCVRTWTQLSSTSSSLTWKREWNLLGEYDTDALLLWMEICIKIILSMRTFWWMRLSKCYVFHTRLFYFTTVTSNLLQARSFLQLCREAIEDHECVANFTVNTNVMFS